MCIYCKRDVYGNVAQLNNNVAGAFNVIAYIEGNTLEMAKVSVDVPEEYDEYFDNTSQTINYCPMCGDKLEKI